jgi:hypothetical protein
VLVVHSKQFRQIADFHCAVTRLKLFNEISSHRRIPPGVIRRLLEHRLEHDLSPILFAYFAQGFVYNEAADV